MNNDLIIIIDDDEDDQHILQEVLRTIDNRYTTKLFSNCLDFIAYLRVTPDKPYLIICDVNIPRMNGIELKKLIDNDEFLNEKSIPFVFYSTAVTKVHVKEAYKLKTQGFFQKETSFEKVEATISLMLNYWRACYHPNNGD
jgi:DNA-binding NarL/FixJ family response regulator